MLQQLRPRCFYCPSAVGSNIAFDHVERLRPLGCGPSGAEPRHTVMRLNPPGQFRKFGSAICGRRREMETQMTTQKVQRLTKLTNQLAETLMTAAICVEEIRTEIRAELDGSDIATAGALGRRWTSKFVWRQPAPDPRPIYTLRHMEYQIATSWTHSRLLAARSTLPPSQSVRNSSGPPP